MCSMETAAALLLGYGARVQSVRVQLYSATKNRCARNRRLRDYSTHHQLVAYTPPEWVQGKLKGIPTHYVEVKGRFRVLVAVVVAVLSIISSSNED